MIEPTERHMQLPGILARKYGNGDFLLEDDLESAGMLALAKACLTYEEGHGAKVDSYLYTCVERACWRVLEQRKCERRGGGARAVSMDYAAGDGVAFAETVGEDCDPGAAIEVAEEVRDVLRRVGPVQRAVLELVRLQELTYEEAALRLGITKQRVSQIVLAVEKRIRRGRRVSDSHAGRRFGIAIDASRRGVDQGGLAKGPVAKKKYAEMRRVVGKVIANGWYLVDRWERKAYGTWSHAKAAYASLGIEIRLPKDGKAGQSGWIAAAAGWPHLSNTGAILLARLVEHGPHTKTELALSAGYSRHTTQQEVAGLRKVGYLPPGKALVYEATPLATAERGPVTRLEPAQGVKVRKLKADGWEVLPAHMVPMPEKGAL